MLFSSTATEAKHSNYFVDEVAQSQRGSFASDIWGEDVGREESSDVSNIEIGGKV